MKRITRRTSTDYYDSLVAYYSLLAYSLSAISGSACVWRPIPYRFHRPNQSIPAPITSRFRLPQPGPQIMATWPDSSPASPQPGTQPYPRYRVTPRVPRAGGKTERSRRHTASLRQPDRSGMQGVIYFPRDREARLRRVSPVERCPGGGGTPRARGPRRGPRGGRTPGAHRAERQ